MKLGNFLAAAFFIVFVSAVSAYSQFDIFGTVNGRVQNAAGRGIGRARVNVINLTTLETQERVTNDFGYFHFEGLPIIDLYVVTVNSKRARFTYPSQVVQFLNLEHFALFVANN